VQGGKRGVNATQQNMAGTGVGTFNDRIRDAVRGGSAFGDRRDQGFATGLWYDPNGFSGSGTRERDQLLGLADAIRIGMAGNLRNYQIIDQFGSEVTGAQLHGVGYTLDPQEAVNYASAHDNETFFDKIQYAAARQASIGDRVRMQNLAASIVLLGQGVPFLHAGFDMLRSKSMDTDSYNSGDWFNKLDWSYGSDNFGVGLPIASKNKDRWPIIKPLLARKDITPERDNIMDAVHGIREFIKIRKSSPLFRLRTGEEVQARVHFHNMGPQQVPGLIVMSISDQVEGLRPIDPNVRRIMVLINATKEKQSFSDPDWKGAGFALHPVQVASHDALVKNARFDADAGTFEVPPRTTAVFVEPE
jgi:pullulanase